MVHQSDPDNRGRYGRRKPRPGLTTSVVVAAGRRVIERDGLDALTMRTVARELDTAATSLYRHVADRDALLLAILEQVAEGLPVTVPGDTAGERLLRRLMDAHDYLAHHVWVLHILIRGDLVAETAFSFVDACFADFLEAGLSPQEALDAYWACWHLMLGELLAQHPLVPPKEPSQRSVAVEGADIDRLPAFARVLGSTQDRAAVGRLPEERFGRAVAALLSALLVDGE
ncbi:TetR/AcrR family transcriptional regulator [Streptomyces sp. NBC_00690]|uniref:TetR/AcrR family transcriptional regulator n=1 Tax=Streptomyces sp. NBC_00690 TaxID=2975808 RepID=UPI002E2E7666|nr:TetR/AcrR family transcriptional regulator [Streptomyces sp. NBC_00690]